MARIKTKEEIAVLRELGRKHAYILGELKKRVVPGITTKELDKIAETMIREGGDTPAFLNYKPEGAAFPFPASACISINSEVVHGIPGDRVVKEGDIVSIDLGLVREGLITDAAITVPVGTVDKKIHELIDVTRESLMVGIEASKPGNTVGDIGHAIESFVRPYKYGIVRDLGGHGVGHHVHEDPFIPNYGNPGSGDELVPGMVIALEPMLSLGNHPVVFLDDGYTVETKDYSWSAHWEHTIAITEDGPVILTEE